MLTDLIDPNSRTWKTEFIVNTFTTVDAERNLRFSLAKAVHDDVLA